MYGVATVYENDRIYQQVQMGQAYCVTLCGEKNEIDESLLNLPSNSESDQPMPNFAKTVKQHIELHAKIKETYMLYRTPHHADKKGTKLELYYLFEFSAYYEGQWKNGLPHGFGRIIYDDGSLYEGCFNCGVAECHQALFIRSDGSFYRGNIKHNKANGYGQLSTPKLFYKGNWVDDLPNGKARQIYSSISFFEGQFINGMKEGNGIYQWNPHEYYIGKFHQNKLEGKGDLITKEYTYKGNFKQGKKEGQGVYTDNHNNFVYKGNFLCNLPHGKGELTFSDGAQFTGEFQGFEKRKGIMKLLTGELVEFDSTLEEEQIEIVQSSEDYSSNLPNLMQSV